MNTPAGETPTQGPDGEDDHEDEFAALYRKDLVLGAAGSTGACQFPLAPLDPEQLARVLANRGDGDEGSGEDEALAEAGAAAVELLERVSVFRVEDGTDPWTVETETDGEFVRVRVLRLAPHSGRSEAEDKVVSGDPSQKFRGHTAVDERGTVAVVDAGLPADWETILLTPRPESWLSWASPFLDVEGAHPWEVPAGPGSVGHGLFVAHLISRLSGARVRIAKMAILDPMLVTKSDADRFRIALDELRGGVLLVDELQVFLAVRRLVRGDGPAEGYGALNLSFAYHDHVGGGFGLAGPAVRAAVALWRDRFPDSPIFAAAGNVDPGSDHQPSHGNPQHPKSLLTTIPGVVSVGSLDEPDGDVSDFSDRGCDWLAVGRDATAISDLSAQKTTWSGTSFACAVATAAYVLDPSLDTRRAVKVKLDPRS